MNSFAKRTNTISVLLVLLGLLALFTVMYLSFRTYGNWEFAFRLRGKKILAFVLVGVSTSFATIAFQTVAENTFLTPSILGLDALYLFLQTILYFFLGGQLNETHPIFLFLVTTILMVGVSSLCLTQLFRQEQADLFLVLMLGMVLGTFFRSSSTFLQVLMDPNEYDKLQGKLFASFQNVDTTLLGIGGVIMLGCLVYLWIISPKLDVLLLGRPLAQGLGIPVKRLQTYILFVVSVLVAVSTALVGPITFLGFITANMVYQLLNTYKHHALFLISSILSVLLLIGGQFFVEQLFHLNTTVSVIVEFVGGVYFIGRILQERKQMT